MNDHQLKLLEYGRLLIRLESERYRYRLSEFITTLDGAEINLPFQVRKLKECRGCGRIFYDVSRNGRMTYCHWIPYARHNYAQGKSIPNISTEGTVKSFCQMRADAGRKRRGFNVDKYGIDSDHYQIRGFYEDYEFGPDGW
jgi:hypothetical protein